MEAAEIITSVLVGIFFGPAFAIFATPFVGILRTIFVVPFLRKHLLEEAKQKGHVIEAKLIKSQDVRDYSSEIGSIGTGKKRGIYVYEYKGKKHKTRIHTYSRLPETMHLYYIKKPRKATLANDLGNWEIPWIKIYLCTSLVIAVVATFVMAYLLMMM